MSIVSDVVERSRLEQTADGFRAERRFVVTDVGGSAASRHYNALLAAGVPRIGEPHPVIPGLPCAQIIVEPLGPSQFEISAIYQISSAAANTSATGGWLIDFAVGVISETRYKDASGARLVATISPGQTFYFQTEVQEPRVIVRAGRKDGMVSHRAAIVYVGALNASVWNGYPPRTWLCAGVSGSPNSNDIEIEFQYANDTWDFEPAASTNTTTGETTYAGPFVLYPQIDFSPLGISF